MEMIRGRGISNGVVQVPNPFANNLLQKFFISSNHFCHRDSENDGEEASKKKEEEDEEKDDVELTLGLSLNGQFGTDPRSRKRKNFELGRSSSIPEGFFFDEQRSGGGVPDMFQLDRTRSLPVVTEIETERKRKRTEKTRTFMESPLKKDKNRVQAAVTEKEKEKARAFLDFKVPPTKEKEEKDRVVVPSPVNGKGKNGNTEKKNQGVSGMEKARNILEDMPCVSTRDVGADGKRVEGFLYWYGGNKEEVKIVCVCHGSFLSPAEFVRHGGGTTVSNDGDVTINPLRHIVVKLPSSQL